jgi:hypothetical protein
MLRLLFELEWIRWRMLKGVEVGIESACSRIMRAKSLETFTSAISVCCACGGIYVPEKATTVQQGDLAVTSYPPVYVSGRTAGHSTAHRERLSWLKVYFGRY